MASEDPKMNKQGTTVPQSDVQPCWQAKTATSMITQKP